MTLGKIDEALQLASALGHDPILLHASPLEHQLVRVGSVPRKGTSAAAALQHTLMIAIPARLSMSTRTQRPKITCS